MYIYCIIYCLSNMIVINLKRGKQMEDRMVSILENGLHILSKLIIKPSEMSMQNKQLKKDFEEDQEIDDTEDDEMLI